jgi:hypothetical protein
MLEKTIRFILRACFEQDIVNYGDCYLQVCKFCGQKAWTSEDVKHKRNCEIGIVLKEIKMATQQKQKAKGKI